MVQEMTRCLCVGIMADNLLLLPCASAAPCRIARDQHRSVSRTQPGKLLRALIAHKVFLRSFCKSQLPHISVNVFFKLVIVKDTLMDV